jgi:uncharacterized protein
MTIRNGLPPEVVSRFGGEDILIDANLAALRGSNMVDLRRAKIESRVNDDGTVSLTGYATTWETEYNVAGGPPYGFVETIATGAATKSLQERDDVRFLFDHEGIPMARNKSATMLLSADEVGLRADIDHLDVVRNVFAAALASAIERGDVDEMSFAFQAIRQEWNADFTYRRITELRLFDVSAVTFPANSATIIGLRREGLISPDARSFPLSLALAQAQALVK